MILIEDCPDPASVALLLRGVSGQAAEQADTSLRKAAAAVAIARGARGHPPGVLPGGGAAEVAVAGAVRDRSTAERSRAQLALERFADAVERLPWQLARNGGADPHGAVADLRAADGGGAWPRGLSLPDAVVVDTVEEGILDPLAVRHRVYTTAVELANAVLNVDDAIDAVRAEERPDPDEARYEDAAEQMRDHRRKQDDEG